jgi:hypothetical protein
VANRRADRPSAPARPDFWDRYGSGIIVAVATIVVAAGTIGANIYTTKETLGEQRDLARDSTLQTQRQVAYIRFLGDEQAAKHILDIWYEAELAHRPTDTEGKAVETAFDVWHRDLVAAQLIASVPFRNTIGPLSHAHDDYWNALEGPTNISGQRLQCLQDRIGQTLANFSHAAQVELDPTEAGDKGPGSYVPNVYPNSTVTGTE